MDYDIENNKYGSNKKMNARSGNIENGTQHSSNDSRTIVITIPTT